MEISSPLIAGRDQASSGPRFSLLGASRANILLRVPEQVNLNLSCRFGSIDVDGAEGT